MAFKRNQLEEAIAAALPEDGLRVRIRRLLDVDRALPDLRGADGGARYAFFSHEPRGTGQEVWFSHYEVFAVLIGLRLMKMGWPQRATVRTMRQVRMTLEPAHAGILNKDPRELFDAERERRDAREGMPATGSTAPVYLGVLRRPNSKPSEDGVPSSAVFDGHASAMEALHNAPVGSAMTLIELTGVAHALAHNVSRIKPRRRGRGPG